MPKFDEFCGYVKATPTEREMLAWYLTYLRMKKTLRALGLIAGKAPK